MRLTLRGAERDVVGMDRCDWTPSGRQIRRASLQSIGPVVAELWGDSALNLEVTLDAYPRRGTTSHWPRRNHTVPALTHAVGDHRRRRLPEVRKPAVHRFVQGARCARKLASLTSRGQGVDRRVGRQPRAGRRLPRPAPRYSGGHRHAALHADRQSRTYARLRRRSPARRRRLDEPETHATALAPSADSTMVHPYDVEP